jgi:large subunit ribosomal protein L19
MRSSALEFIESRQLRKEVAEFRPGDTVRVNWIVKEGDKEREQAFEGMVIRKKRGGIASSFTVRKISFGVGVERVFPLHSPRYSSIEVLSRGNVNRNRLFYLRGLKGKSARVDIHDENELAEKAAASAAAAAAKAAQ